MSSCQWEVLSHRIKLTDHINGTRTLIHLYFSQKTEDKGINCVDISWVYQDLSFRRGVICWILFPQNLLNASPPSTSMWLCLERGPAKSQGQVKVQWGHMVGPWSNLSGVFIKWGRHTRDAHTERTGPVRTKQGGSHLQARERLQEKLNLPIPWSWTSSLQNCAKINFCCLSYKSVLAN